MTKGRNASERVERLRALFDAGDHGAVRRLAGEIVTDGAASDAEREAAAEHLARIAPDVGIVIAALSGIAAAVAIGVWLIVH